MHNYSKRYFNPSIRQVHAAGHLVSWPFTHPLDVKPLGYQRWKLFDIDRGYGERKDIIVNDSSVRKVGNMIVNVLHWHKCGKHSNISIVNQLWTQFKCWFIFFPFLIPFGLDSSMLFKFYGMQNYLHVAIYLLIMNDNELCIYNCLKYTSNCQLV